MALQQPPSPLDTISGLQPADEQQKQLEERLSTTYVPRVIALLIRQRKEALAMRRKPLF
jgi:hypothetical protein